MSSRFPSFLIGEYFIVSVLATNLGFPRIGAQRELMKSLESYWRGESSRDMLFAAAARLRERHWKLQQAARFDHIPSNDFSLYDHILDLSLSERNRI